MTSRFSEALDDAQNAASISLPAKYRDQSETFRKSVTFSQFIHFEVIFALINGLAKRVSEEFDVLEKRVEAAPAVVRLEHVEIEQEPDDYRRLKRTETWSDGRKFVSRLRNDGPLFLGAYTRGTRYDRGDWVVFGGSTWACMNETSESPGTGSADWRIAARRGGDGR